MVITTSSYTSVITSIQPFSCGSDPITLTAVETFTVLVEVHLYTFLFKLVELLSIFMAQEEL